jgi:hypothetical protein
MYELFEKRPLDVPVPNRSIKLSASPAMRIMRDGCISLNCRLWRNLRDSRVEAVLLLWEAKRRQMAMKAAEPTDCRAYTVSPHPSGAKFLRAIGWRCQEAVSLPATWNESEQMIEVTLPDECVASERES